MSNAIEKLTWSKLIKIEPQLLALYKEAKAVEGSAEHFCANNVWYEHFKPRLFPLVGWDWEVPQPGAENAGSLGSGLRDDLRGPAALPGLLVPVARPT